MGKIFKQMSHNDRIKMEALLNAGHSKAEVAKQLHFHRSTIYREYDKGKYMHRNSDYTEEERYSSDLGQKAHDYAQEGKGRALKIGNDRELAECIEDKIVNDKYSPEAALAEIAKGKKHNKKVKVQKRASAGESIENRPEEVKDREIFGHWEMDTVKGQRGVTKSCMLVLTERKTRDEIIIKLKDQTAASVVEALDRLERKWGDMFSKVFRSITVDNGVEFADYEGMEKSVFGEEKRTFVFYCHPYSSWERGSNENNNRLIRRHIPKGEDFDGRQDAEIEYIEKWINDYPRGIFDYRTSAELFEEELQKLA